MGSIVANRDTPSSFIVVFAADMITLSSMPWSRIWESSKNAPLTVEE
jgi:hypothetical protein